MADLTPDMVTWPGPLAFERSDGWRGALNGIIGSAVREMERLGFGPRTIGLDVADDRLGAACWQMQLGAALPMPGSAWPAGAVLEQQSAQQR